MKKILLILMIAALPLGLTACNAYGTDNTPKPTALTPIKQTFPIKKMWSTRADSGVGKSYLKLTPALDKDHVFVADSRGRVTAMDMATGHKLWQVNTKLPITAGPSLSENQLFVGTSTAQVLALDQRTGKTLWKTKVSSEILAPPTAAKGIVVVKSIDGQLTALDEKTGKERWHYKVDVPSLILRASSPVIIENNTVFAGFANGKLTSLSLNKGEQLWEKAIASPDAENAISNMVDIAAAPVINDDVIYVATYQGNIAALTLNTGDILWQHKMSSYAGIALDKKHVYVSDAKSNIYAFDQASGGINWKQDKLTYRNITGPAVMLDTVVVGDAQGYLFWLSQEDGHLLAQLQVKKSAILATPLPYENLLIVTTTDGTVSAYEIG